MRLARPVRQNSGCAAAARIEDMPLPKLTESMIRAGASPESFQRGRDYFESGAISNASIQESTLLAECAGTSAPYYQVRVELDGAGIRDVECTCPYDWGGWCKHIVALLLTYVHDRQQFAVRAQPAELLGGLGRDELAALLGKLMREQPGLYDRVAAAVAAPAKAKPGKARPRKTVDFDVYRRRVIGILHSLDSMRASEAYWHVGGLVRQLEEVQESATKFLEAGEPQAALDILLVLLEEASRGIEYVDDSDGEFGDFFAEIGLRLAEAILSLEFSSAERRKLTARLTELDARLSGYGLDDTLNQALQAAEHGWDRPAAKTAARRAARGPVSRHSWGLDEESGAFAEDDWDSGDDEDDDAVDGEDDGRGEWHAPFEADLTDVKLSILGRRGEVDAYLKLCLETNRHWRYAVKLAEVGRVAEAVKHGRQKLRTADEARQLAEALRTGGHVAEALVIGERGLKLAPPRHGLAAWLAPLEEGQGRTPAALAAWQAAFSEEPSLAIYQSLKHLAGAKWKKLRPNVMTNLRRSGDKQALVEVLIEEQDWDEAIEVADGRQAGYGVVETVADAVLPHRPEWVARASRRHAERLMQEPKSQNYPLAAAWLKRAKKAHSALDQAAEWRDYLEKIKEKYRRRPALQAQLRGL